jgi:hypothetical protein
MNINGQQAKQLLTQLLASLERRIKLYESQYKTANVAACKSMLASKNMLCRNLALELGYEWCEKQQKLIAK